MPLVDVITPTIAGREHLLLQACESVSAQTCLDLGHRIAVDTERIGPGFLRNQLVQQSDAEWLVFLDDDDLLDPQFVEWHLNHARHHRADLVYANCRVTNGYRGWRPPRHVEFDEARLRRSNYIPVTVLLRRSWFEAVKGFPTSFTLEDWKLWLNLLDAGAVFKHLPCVCWSYRVHGNQYERNG